MSDSSNWRYREEDEMSFPPTDSLIQNVQHSRRLPLPSDMNRGKLSSRNIRGQRPRGSSTPSYDQNDSPIGYPTDDHIQNPPALGLGRAHFLPLYKFTQRDPGILTQMQNMFIDYECMELGNCYQNSVIQEEFGCSSDKQYGLSDNESMDTTDSASTSDFTTSPVQSLSYTNGKMSPKSFTDLVTSTNIWKDVPSIPHTKENGPPPLSSIISSRTAPKNVEEEAEKCSTINYWEGLSNKCITQHEIDSDSSDSIVIDNDDEPSEIVPEPTKVLEASVRVSPQIKKGSTAQWLSRSIAMAKIANSSEETKGSPFKECGATAVDVSYIHKRSNLERRKVSSGQYHGNSNKSTSKGRGITAYPKQGGKTDKSPIYEDPIGLYDIDFPPFN